MFKTMPLQKKFTVMLIIIFLISLPLVGTAAYVVLQKNTYEAVFEQATFFLNTMETIRTYVGKVIRPAAQESMPGKFDVRLMSTSYAARGVAERMKEKFPDYTFRHISANPRNKVNIADSFEQGLIQSFSQNRKVMQTNGFISKGGAEYFYVAKPIVSDNSCMPCHSTPNLAPKEVIATYGSTAAFGWQPDQVVASLIVYVPTKLAKSHAFKALLTFMILYSVVFIVILIMIDRAIVSSIIKPIKDFAETADEVSKGNFEKEFSASGSAEMKMLGEAFRRMKASIVASMNMIERFKKGSK